MPATANGDHLILRRLSDLRFSQKQQINFHGNSIHNIHLTFSHSKRRVIDLARNRKDTGADPYCDRLSDWDRRTLMDRVSDRAGDGAERDFNRCNDRDTRNRPGYSDSVHRSRPDRRRFARLRAKPGRGHLLRRVDGLARMAVRARRNVLSRRDAYRPGEQLRRPAFSLQRDHLVRLRRESAAANPDLRGNEVHLSVSDRFSDRVLYTMWRRLALGLFRRKHRARARARSSDRNPHAENFPQHGGRAPRPGDLPLQRRSGLHQFLPRIWNAIKQSVQSSVAPAKDLYD